MRFSPLEFTWIIYIRSEAVSNFIPEITSFVSSSCINLNSLLSRKNLEANESIRLCRAGKLNWILYALMNNLILKITLSFQCSYITDESLRIWINFNELAQFCFCSMEKKSDLRKFLENFIYDDKLKMFFAIMEFFHTWVPTILFC